MSKNPKNHKDVKEMSKVWPTHQTFDPKKQKKTKRWPQNQTNVKEIAISLLKNQKPDKKWTFY